MMKTIKLTLILMVCALCSTQAQQKENEITTNNTNIMKTYVIERNIPGAGNLTAEELKGISQASCNVLEEMGSEIEWIHSYVTGDKVYCVYKATQKSLIEQHAQKGGFPANTINQVATVISPATARQ